MNASWSVRGSAMPDLLNAVVKVRIPRRAGSPATVPHPLVKEGLTEPRLHRSGQRAAFAYQDGSASNLLGPLRLPVSAAASKLAWSALGVLASVFIARERSGSSPCWWRKSRSPFVVRSEPY